MVLRLLALFHLTGAARGALRLLRNGTNDDLIREASAAGLTLEQRARCPLTGRRKTAAGESDGVISVEWFVFSKPQAGSAL